MIAKGSKTLLFRSGESWERGIILTFSAKRGEILWLHNLIGYSVDWAQIFPVITILIGQSQLKIGNIYMPDAAPTFHLIKHTLSENNIITNSYFFPKDVLTSMFICRYLKNQRNQKRMPKPYYP